MELQIFENVEFGIIRSMNIKGEPWFVGKDVAGVLGYKETAKVIREHVDIDDRGVSVLDTPGGKQEMVIINESGVYALVFGSKLPAAKRFKRWVTSEVLPAIRKTGKFEKPQTLAEQMAQGLFAAQKLLEAKDRQIEEMTPKAIFADAVSTSKTSILIGDLAKILKGNGVDIGQRRLFGWLREHGYLMKCGESYNMPTQKAMELKLFEVKESTVNNPDGSIRITKTTKCTGKGQQYFVNKFLKGAAC